MTEVPPDPAPTMLLEPAYVIAPPEPITLSPAWDTPIPPEPADDVGPLPPLCINDEFPAAPPLLPGLRQMQPFAVSVGSHPARQGQGRPSKSSRRKSLEQFDSIAAVRAIRIPLPEPSRGRAI